jgi:hypothetical protein
MSAIVEKYVKELLVDICKDYGSDDKEELKQLTDDFTKKLTTAFTKFENEIISNDIPLDDMLSIASKVGGSSTAKKNITITPKKGGNGWTLFSKKFTKANGWTKEETSNAWKALTKDEKDKFNLEAKQLREDDGNNVVQAAASGEKRANPWTGFQKYYKYETNLKNEKYTPGGCSAAYKKLSDEEKESYRGWVLIQSTE